jgi:hypothetical protein
MTDKKNENIVGAIGKNHNITYPENDKVEH